MTINPIALVTGSSRGIGFEVAKQLAARDYRLIVTSRSETSAAAAAAKIGGHAVAHALDTSDAASIRELAAWIKGEFAQLDVVVNNAAILLGETTSILDTPPEMFEQTLRTNALGPLLVTQAVANLLRRSKATRVVNVSSGAGQISSMSSYAPAYSISKATLNAITVMLAHALPHARVNCVDPGWVRTDMGGRNATRSVEEGAETIVWLATLPDDGPTGGFFHDRRPIAW
ncbi:MAG TPA: SDR family NAD(P)-dependent oxidoreductase [Thermoanaerobaculia bacterium]|jgi:NAD(P)-dependent dehydrogenase (short-subunit alcohol dehydrogenase family)|nr:SDR family NAD(P)-dependent oxidoreductase [Thermoanaerobaculia bacterium]